MVLIRLEAALFCLRASAPSCLCAVTARSRVPRVARRALVSCVARQWGPKMSCPSLGEIAALLTGGFGSGSVSTERAEQVRGGPSYERRLRGLRGSENADLSALIPAASLRVCPD